MHLPRWLRMVSVLVVLNAILVCWSVIQHHVFAIDRAPETPAQQDPIGITENSEQNAIVSRQQTELVPPVLQEVASGTVSQDDPLLKEIRRQAAEQFGEISETAGSFSAAATLSPSASQPNLTSVDDLQLLQLKMQVVVKMSQAAQQLSEMAVRQKQIGQPEQAEATLARILRLTTLMQEMLSH